MDLGRESLGAKSQKLSPKSLEKVSKSLGLGSQKSGKSLEKGPKSPPKVRKWVFGDFSDGFRDFFRTFGTPTEPGRPFRDFLETFWLLAPRLPLPGPRNSNLVNLNKALSCKVLRYISQWSQSCNSGLACHCLLLHRVPPK